MVRRTLSRQELAWAMEVGVKRYRGLPRGARHEGRSLGEVLLDAVNGACGELAAARVLGLAWPALVDTYSGLPDFPEQDLEVKTTSTDMGLAIRPREALHLAGAYVLVQGMLTPMTLVGWLPRQEVQGHLDKDLRNLAQTHWIAVEYLWPITTLEDRLRKLASR